MSVATKSLLSRLLRDAPEPVRAGDDVGAWWRAFCASEPRASTPIDRAVIAGFRADRLAGAFAGGYQAALRTLVPGVPAHDCILSLCVTEQAGNSPRAIEAHLAPRAGGGFTLSGRKRWSTMAPLASVLLVAASEGVGADGRKRFKLVRVEAGAPGITIHRMPATAFVPEVPHAELELVDVAVRDDAPLPGDGYTAYVKRFRTIEDIHIHGAVLGYVLSVARRFDFPQRVIERLASAITTTRVLAAMDPDAPETHIALAGTLGRDTTLLDHSDTHWQTVEAEEQKRWKRDRAMFDSVAGQIREARRARAWERLRQGE
jgi:alkylation response protein AidB-like acyl-CoA dehydrogenase